MLRRQLPYPLVHLSEFFHVEFKNYPKYHTRGDTQVFIPLVKFLLQTFLSRSFILLTYSFLTFSYILAFVLWCLLPIYSTTSNFSSFFYLQEFCCFPAFAVLSLPLFLFSPSFIINIVHFSIQNSIPIYELHCL